MNEFMYDIGDTVEITPYLQRYTEIQTHNRAERFAIKKDVVDDMVKFAGQTAIVNELSGINYIGYRLDIDGRFHK